MKSVRWRWLSLAGLCCTSLCVLGLPLLGLGLAAVGLDWRVPPWLMRTMLVMFLAMYGIGTMQAHRGHRRWGPGLFAVTGGVLLLGTSWHAVPHAAGWLALVLLAAGWAWDVRLVLRGHHG